MNKRKKGYIFKIIIPLILLVVIGVIAKNTGLFGGLDGLITISFENIIKVVVAIAFIMVLENILLTVLLQQPVVRCLVLLCYLCQRTLLQDIILKEED